jgi:phosphatidate cytidylyltransferase
VVPVVAVNYKMLRYRLLFGVLMTAFFSAVVIFGGWMDGSLTDSVADDKPVRGTVFCVLVVLLAIPAQRELAKLATEKNLKIFIPFSIVASILFATYRYWQQEYWQGIIEIRPETYLTFLSAFVLMGLLLYQHRSYGTSAVLANCGANYFSILYLGLLSSFCVGIRVEFGLWPLLMFVFVIKCSDIGAYAIGTLFGKHKFSPKISPNKSWEGMGGAVIVAMIVAIGFAVSCDIMVWWLAAIFGLCFAFLGQMGDLVESMMKRDAEQKDSASNVPGFGGILDIVDSLLVAAPFGYLFFMLSL